MNNKSSADLLRESFKLQNMGFNTSDVFSILIKGEVKIIESKNELLMGLIKKGYTVTLKEERKEVYEVK